MKTQDVRWMRIRDLFEQAVDMPTETREAFIDQNCGDDDGLRDELKSLLASDVAHREARSRGPLTGAIGAAVDATTKSRREELLGGTIGPYRLTQILGHGGAGTVYLGERADRQYSAQVAIKVVEGAALNAEIGRRFKAERQILASLNHQNIARLIDAGETQEGYPYLVMEYVHGEPIDKYCDRKKLNVEQRIDLVLKVCGAIQYAHQNLIVHRDIKPGNILVLPDGTPKLLDFGIAKLLDTSDAAAAMALTRMNDRVLTPEYASPEQILGQNITTASDVYSLGMVLFELLTGLRPYKITTSSQLELERTICVIDSSRASTVVRQALTQVTSDTPQSRNIHTIAETRQITPMRLRARLNGDLDAILARALRKEAIYRYNSVEQFADDLRRHLAREPVSARQGNWVYYTQRFARRHAFGVAAASGFVVLITAALIVVSIQSKRIAAERDIATQEKQTSEAVASFMMNVFDAADPFTVQDREVTAKELLDNAADRIHADLGQQAGVKARLLESIGRSYERQGHADRGVDLLKEAVEIQRDTSGENKVVLVSPLRSLGKALLANGDIESARNAFLEAQAILEKSDEPETATLADILADLGRLELDAGNVDLSRKYADRAIPMLRQAYSSDHTEVASALTALGQVLKWQNEYKLMEDAAREAVRIYQASLPELHPDRLLTERLLAESLFYQGNIEAAAPLIEKALTNRRKVFGATSSSIALDLQLMSELRRAQDRFLEAETYAVEALEVKRLRHGERNYNTAYARTTLATIQLRLGKLSDAEQQLRAAIDVYLELFPPEHLYIASAEYFLAEVLVSQRKYDEAINMTKLTLDRLLNANVSAWRIARTENTLGQAYFKQHKLGLARQYLEKSYQTLLSDSAADKATLELARHRLEEFNANTGDVEKTGELRR